MAGWAHLYELLTNEFVQRRDEGCQIPQNLRQRFAELHPECDAWNSERINPLYDDLMALEADPELAAREPNELADIRALRPEGPRHLRWEPSPDELQDRLHGAWIGRCTGCALGKPVEGMGMSRAGGRLNGRRRIKQYLQRRGDWPLRDFFSGRDAGDGEKVGCPASCRETIAFMEPDDDIHYSLVGLGVLEQFGPDFIWEDVGTYWGEHIPYRFICTAEIQAFTNLIDRTGSHRKVAATPAFTRRYRNPYREWIGAQIRADGWAWACAGKPELAAEFAYRDACWTHERNGIYGEMFFAAIQSASFCESNPRHLVEIGLSEIPRDCRLAQYVRSLLEWIPQCRNFEDCAERIEQTLPDMSGGHTLNNALVCVQSLFFGMLDTVEAPAIAVMSGLDTDCNGATVGSIVGAVAGHKRFKMDLAQRLNDTVKPAMVGFGQVTLAELARRTAVVWHKVDEYARIRGQGI